MRTISLLSRLCRPAFIAALSFLLPLAALAQVTEGSASNGSTTEGSASNGSTTEGSASNGSTTVGSASTGGTTTSYDSPNVYDLGGGTVTLATAILNGGTVTNGTLNASSSFLGNSGSVSAQLAGTGYLDKTTIGTLILSGANTYTNVTNITAGTLLVNGSLANTTTTVFSGATLGGTGSIGGPTTIQAGGILAPGDSVGTLTFTNGLTLNSGAVLNFDLGTTSDLLVVNGGVLAGPSSGNVTLNLTDAGGLTAATYDLFTFTGATLSGFDASDFTLGTAPTGWNYTFGLTANSLQLTVTAVPEPTTYAAIFGTLALGCILLRRRLRP